MRQVLKAIVLRVIGCDAFDANIELGFGVSVRKVVRLRRRAPVYLYDGFAPQANHCLVVLIGGKEVVLENPVEDGRAVIADVYFTAVGVFFPVVSIPGIVGSFISVHEAMHMASTLGWDARQVREGLKP